MEQEPKKYWYNSGVIIKDSDENRVMPFRFSRLGEEEGGDGGIISYATAGDSLEEDPTKGREAAPGHQGYGAPGENELKAIYEEAKQKGFEEGKTQGYQEGLNKGKKEGFAAGFQEGFQKGLQEGKREGLAISEKRFQGLMERAKESLERLANARKELLDSLRSYEAELVSLAFEIGASIAMKELEEKPESIGEIVQKALEKIGESSEVVVKLNPKDLTVLKESGGLETEGIQLVSSPNLRRGGCIVETEKGVVNATVENRVREVADSLIKGDETDACN